MNQINQEKQEEWDAHEIIENLYIGSQSAESVPFDVLKQKNIKYILTSGFGLEQNHTNQEIKYKKIKAIDISLYNILNDLPECIIFIEEALESGSSILIHCQMGVSRSASIVIGYLMKRNRWKYSVALNEVRKFRKVVHPNSGFRDQLEWFEKMEWKFEGDSEAHRQYKNKWNPLKEKK